MSYDADVDTLPPDPEQPEILSRDGGYEPEPEPEGVRFVPTRVPTLSLPKLRDAAFGSNRYTVGVKAVQRALVSRRFLAEGEYRDGMFDSGTMRGYRNLQLHLGFTAESANGVPDRHSFTWLALRTGLYQAET